MEIRGKTFIVTGGRSGLGEATAAMLEREGAIGRLHGEVLATTGNGTTVADARRFGMEWAADLRQQNIQAVILTAT